MRVVWSARRGGGVEGGDLWVERGRSCGIVGVRVVFELVYPRAS